MTKSASYQVVRDARPHIINMVFAQAGARLRQRPFRTPFGFLWVCDWRHIGRARRFMDRLPDCRFNAKYGYSEQRLIKDCFLG